MKKNIHTFVLLMENLNAKTQKLKFQSRNEKLALLGHKFL